MYLILNSFFLLSSIFFHVQSVELSISFTNIKEAKGNLMVFLGDEKGEFIKGAEVPVTKKGTVVYQFENLTPGKYTVRVFHDIDSNEELNKNGIGMPTEPYGFSNNARGRFGPPDVEDQVFSVEEKTQIEIKLD